MTGWIEKDEVVPGCRLRLGPDGTEGDRALLRPLQIVHVDVRLLRYWPLRPSRPDIVLDVHGDEQQHGVDRDDRMVLRGDDGHLPAEQSRPESAQWFRIITVERYGQTHPRHAGTLRIGVVGHEREEPVNQHERRLLGRQTGASPSFPRGRGPEDEQPRCELKSEIILTTMNQIG